MKKLKPKESPLHGRRIAQIDRDDARIYRQPSGKSGLEEPRAGTLRGLGEKRIRVEEFTPT